MIFPENYQEFYEQQAKRNRRDSQFGGYGAVHPFFWDNPAMTEAMKPRIVPEQRASSGGADRMAEWMMRQAMNQEGKGEYLAEKQQQQTLKEERGMKQRFLDDARKEILDDELGTSYKDPKTGEPTSFKELPGAEQNRIIADKARSRYQLAKQAGVLPQVETVRTVEPKKEKFGGGSIKVTGEARKGDPYGKGAIAAAFNDGRLLILEPDDEGKYKGKQRVTNDKTGVSSWQPMKNSLTRDEVDALMGAAKKHTVIEANTSKNAKAVKAVTTTPKSTKVDIEKRSRSGNMLPPEELSPNAMRFPITKPYSDVPSEYLAGKNAANMDVPRGLLPGPESRAAAADYVKKRVGEGGFKYSGPDFDDIMKYILMYSPETLSAMTPEQ